MTIKMKPLERTGDVRRMWQTVPIYVLSGFLGSGKTTLLTQWVQHCKEQGLRPAVVMNELGEVNLDGAILGGVVPMAEMLSGCICCTIRGDLGLEIRKLLEAERPDIVLIEATGAANPLEVIEGVTEVSLLNRAEIRGLVTVADAAHLAHWLEKGKGKTLRLMEEQIRCASLVLLNKTDLVPEERLADVERRIRAWNGAAELVRTQYCRFDPDWMRPGAALSPEEGQWSRSAAGNDRKPHEGEHEERNRHDGAHDHHNDHGPLCDHGHDRDDGSRHSAHHTHEHVMVYTHYFSRPVHSESFEALFARLPESVYRAKGILTFTDTSARFLFQYAYRQLDFMRIEPQGEVPDVAVFIGEHFPKDAVKAELDKLEKGEFSR